jgi:hypothetical protein
VSRLDTNKVTQLESKDMYFLQMIAGEYRHIHHSFVSAPSNVRKRVYTHDYMRTFADGRELACVCTYTPEHHLFLATVLKILSRCDDLVEGLFLVVRLFSPARFPLMSFEYNLSRQVQVSRIGSLCT